MHLSFQRYCTYSFFIHLLLFFISGLLIKDNTIITLKSTSIELVSDYQQSDMRPATTQTIKTAAAREPSFKNSKSISPSDISERGLNEKDTFRERDISENIKPSENIKKDYEKVEDTLEQRAVTENESITGKEFISDNKAISDSKEQAADGIGEDNNLKKIKWQNTSVNRYFTFEPDFIMPGELKGKGINTQVIASIKVDKDGNILNITLIKKSQYSVLDSAIIENLYQHRVNKISTDRIDHGTVTFTYTSKN